MYPDLTDYELEQIRSGILQSLYINKHGVLVDEKDVPEDADIVGGPSPVNDPNEITVSRQF